MRLAPRLALPALERKLLRDLWRMRGQALAIALVACCGTASYVTLRGAYEALLAARTSYYAHYRFADVFLNLKRAPATLLARAQEIPGVNLAHGRVVIDASLDVPGLDEPASGRLISLPEGSAAGLNQVYLRSGRLPLRERRDEALVSEAFASANRLQLDDRIGAVINGRRQNLRMVGIAISPEYVAEMKGTSFPDNRRFGVLWMDHEALAGAVDMRDSFNDLSVSLAPHASQARVIEQLDQLLAPYGSLGAYGRKEQLSNDFLDNELASSRVTASVLPAIFLAVVAFLIHNALLRITRLQRAQIALLKSFGYSSAVVALHYVKFALWTVGLGGLAGIALGYWMGGGLARMYARFYHFPDLHYALSAKVAITAMLIALLCAALGAALAASRVLRLPPAEAMRPASPERYRAGRLEQLGLQRWLPLPMRIVLRNLGRNAAKAALSVGALAMAVALVITGQYSLDALNEVIRLQFRMAQREDMTVTFNEARGMEVAANLAALPGVLRVEPFRSAAVRLRHTHHAKKTAIIGLEPQRQLRLLLDAQERPLTLPEDGIVLSRKLAEVLDIAEGGPLRIEFLEGSRRIVTVKVQRILDEPIGVFAYMRIEALARLMDSSVTVSGAWLRIDSAAQQQLFRALKGAGAVGSVNLREATLQSFLSTVAQNIRINTLVMIAFACAIAVGIVYNSARIALSEHALELASLRILGFTRQEVAALLLGEQALLVALAAPLGCLAGFGMAALLAWLLSSELFRMPLVVGRLTYAMAVGAVFAAATGSDWLVWRKLRRLDLIEVLKTRE